MTLESTTRNSFVACKTVQCHYQEISLVPRDGFISPGNTHLGPGSSLAPGDFSALSGSIQALLGAS